MSATTQLLMEQLEELRITIAAKRVRGEDVSELTVKMASLEEKLFTASQALNESKQILKG
jgi:hypothetical protein